MRLILTLALLSILLQTVAPVGAQAAGSCEGLAPTRLENLAYAVNAGDLPTALREEPES